MPPFWPTPLPASSSVSSAPPTLLQASFERPSTNSIFRRRRTRGFCLRRKTKRFVRGRDPERDDPRFAALFRVVGLGHWRIGTDRHVYGDRIALLGCARVHNFVAFYRAVIAGGAPIRQKIAQFVTARGFPERVGLVGVARHECVEKLCGSFLFGIVAKREPNDDRQRNDDCADREGKDVRLFLLFDTRFQK